MEIQNFQIQQIVIVINVMVSKSFEGLTFDL